MGWSRFLRRSRWDAERSHELESYIQIETDDNIARGMAPDAAREAALRRLGNRTRIREDIYTLNTVGALDTLGRDVRYGLRVLRRNPTYACAVLMTLAVGIGANTAIFTVINSVLLEPLPYPSAERLVAVANTAPGAPGLATVSGQLRLSPSMYVTYSEENRTFEQVGIWFATTATVTGVAEPEQVRSVLVSNGTLAALAVAPLLGRSISPSDHALQAAPAVMLTHGYWQRRFGGDPSVVGRPLTVDTVPRTIVGVMPQGFRVVNADADVIVPLSFDRSRLVRAGFGFQGVARLRPGVTIVEADADLARMLPIWIDAWPGGTAGVYEGWRITPALRPLKEEVVGNIGEVLWVLMGTLAVVMVIACANVANLLLVRVDGRQQELAVRFALGAGSWRIVRELLLESITLGLVGGVFGTALAFVALRFLVALAPDTLPRREEIAIDPAALGFALGVSLLAGLFFGLIPALKYARPRLTRMAGGAGRSTTADRQRHRTRNVLVVAQVALALVLLVSSGLMIRTVRAMRAVDPGFASPAQIQTMRVAIPATAMAEPERVARTYQALTERLVAIPGVSSAALANALPMEGVVPNWDGIFAEGKVYPEGEFPPLRLFKSIAPGLFATMGMPLIGGRDFTWTDIHEKRRVAILSESLARELFGSAAGALGKRIGQGRRNINQEVIGVVADVRDNGVDVPAPATVYWPVLREGLAPGGPSFVARNVTIVLRSGLAGTASLQTQVEQAVWAVNSNLAITSVRTMQDIYDTSLARVSFALVMLAIAGAMALLLGVVGIYGVIAYTVTQRRRDIGIRLALGAQQGELRRAFVRDGLVLASLGIVIGVAAAVAATRFMTALLFEVSALDPPSYLASAMILMMAAALASYVPARRASAIPPAQALAVE